MDKLKIIRFQGPLFRANRNKINNYSGAQIKYFTLNETELDAYTKRNMPYKKQWLPTEELILIDILHLPTRRALEGIIGNYKDSLNFSFPIETNKVSRVSEANATHHDYNVLKAICDLGQFDGYYMKATSNFHSEVGLCKSGIKKLKLQSVEKAIVAPQITKRTRTNKPVYFSPIQTAKTLKINNTSIKSLFSPINLFGKNNTTRKNKKNGNNGNNSNLPSIKTFKITPPKLNG